MEIPVNLLMWCMAALPIVFMIFAMLKLDWSAAKAAPCAMAIALLVAIFLYQTDMPTILTQGLKGVWNALIILMVVWPAIFFYELSLEADAFRTLKEGIQKISKHELLLIMIFGWVFPSFLQGITGFGVAVAVGAPLLVGLGVAPVWSVVIVLLCHSWGTTFGTLSLAWQALLEQTQVGGAEAASAALIACAFLWAYNFAAGVCLCWFYGKGAALKEGLPALILISAIQGGGQLLIAQFNSTVACFLPTCLSLLVVLWLGKSKRYGKSWRLEDSRIMARVPEKPVPSTGGLTFNQAIFPYYLLTGIAVVCLLVPPVTKVLSQWKIGFSFPAQTTGYGYEVAAEAFYSPLAPLTYAGTFLVIISTAAYWYYKKTKKLQPGSFSRMAHRTLKKTLPTSAAIMGLIVMSKVMAGSGMIEVLSQGVAQVLGEWYALAAPLIGALGSFATNSNMSSNILFGKFQMTTAELLNIPVAFFLAAQTVGGAIGTAMEPGSVILGASTTGISGQEGKIMRTVLPVSLSMAALCGIVVFVMVKLAS